MANVNEKEDRLQMISMVLTFLGIILIVLMAVMVITDAKINSNVCTNPDGSFKNDIEEITYPRFWFNVTKQVNCSIANGGL